MTITLKKALIAALKDDEVQQILAGIVNRALQRKMEMTDGKTKPGADPVVKEMDVNVIDELVKYLPHVEGRILGLQSDVGQNMNSAANLADQVRAMSAIVLDLQPAIMASVKIYKLLEKAGRLDALVPPAAEVIKIEDNTASENQSA